MTTNSDKTFTIITEPCGKIIALENEEANPFSFLPQKGKEIEYYFPVFVGVYPLNESELVFELISFDHFKGNIVMQNSLEQIDVKFFREPENHQQWKELIQKHNQEKLIHRLETKADKSPLCGSVLNTLGFMSFVLDNSEYRLAGNVPNWYKVLFPNYNYSSDVFDLTDIFPFLEVFLPEAEEVYDKQIDAKIVSGLWTENSATGQEVILKAIAIYENGNCLLLLEPISERYPSKQKDLQRSRELSLQHNQLLKTENTLRDVLKYREQFISIFSHDIKGPLSGTVALMNLLSTDEGFMKAFEPQHEHIFNVISKGLKDLYNYSEKLYEWSNINFGQPEIEIATVDLTYLFKQVLLSLENKLKDKSISVNLDIETDLTISVDEVFFKSALFNIIINALKFSEPFGEISIYTKTSESTTTILIKDEGKGMSDEVKNTLFNYDEKKSTTGTAGEKGTGIGLTIVKKIMDMHQAILVVDSELGKGTTVSITIQK